MLRRYGVETTPAADPAPMKSTTLADALEDCQAPIGLPGTKFGVDKDDAEPIARYRPVVVRGTNSNPGLYERMYRQEPRIFDAVQSYTELIVSAVWEIQCDLDRLEPEIRPVMERWIAHQNDVFGRLAGGWDRFLEQTTSALLIYGFLVNEVIWCEGPYGPEPAALAYREPSTVDGWIMDERGSDLLGCRFQVGGTHATRYFLPNVGEELDDKRMLLFSLAQRGSNFEGISPLRSIIHWTKTKQLLSQIISASAERYGAPLLTLRADPNLADKIPGWSPDQEDISQAINQIANLRAIDLGVMEVPDGLLLEVVGPANQCPVKDFLEVLEYCDTMIVNVFSNEGSLLGMQNAGHSYALAEVAERSFIRSAPFYARKIAEPINELLRLMIESTFGPQPVYPEMTFRIDALTDSKRWLDDAMRLFPSVPVTDWPEEWQDKVYSTMGVQAPAVEVEEAPAEEIAKVSLNGAQIQGVLSIVEANKAGIMDSVSAIELLSLSFPFTREQARVIIEGRGIAEVLQ